VWVLARPRDPGLALLEPPPAGVRFIVAHEAAALDGAPEPEVLLDCWAGRGLLEAALTRAPRLRWLHSRSAGLDRVLFPELLASPAVVTNGKGAFSAALAEFVAAAVLFFAKDLRRLVRSQAERRWDPFEMQPLAGQRLGIVGYGDIGRAVAARLRPFGMRVAAVRRQAAAAAPEPLLDELVPRERLSQLLQRCDYGVLALPLTPETRGLIDARALAALPPTAVLINVGRGAVVDEAALVAALRARRLRGAALDVFETEPLPEGHPFYSLENVLLSPHCADNVPGWIEGGMQVFLDNLERYRRGEPLANLVDKARGY
jgi:phosphoglycerate dehydrogenase-like enzyme